VTSTQLSLGSDPELLLVDKQEQIVCAGDVISETKSAFGVDGHKYIAELRPTAAIHPRDFVSSIRDVLKSRISTLNKYIWRAGPWVCEKPLGGHIHFGTPYQDSLVSALDGQFAPILALIEPATEAAKRRTTVFYGSKPYGLLSDYRKKNWGFEWRTPSSFITTPGVTLGALTIAKAIVWEELNKGKHAFSCLTEQQRELLKFKPEDFYSCKREVFLPMLEALEVQLSKMLYFNKNQEGHDLWPAVSYILHQVIPKKGYTCKNDVKQKWKLESELDTTYLETLPPLWKDLIKNRQAKEWYTEMLPEQADQFILKDENNQALDQIPESKTKKWKPFPAEQLWTSLE
jgi:hypothetical protein